MDINNCLYTAIITPMSDNGSIDFESFEKLIRIQEKANVGVLILGSTGEALNLTEKERYSVVDFVSQLGLNIPVSVGVGGYNLDEQCQWIEYCNKLNFQSFLLVTPIYAKPGTKGQTQWFLELLNKSTKPCMLYNVPSRTGINLCYETLKDIASHKNLWAIKEASGDIERFEKYSKIAPNMRMYTGEDAMVPALAKVGCVGLVSVVANIWPLQTKEYVKAAVNQSISESDISMWNQATAACFEASNPIPVKVFLAENNTISSDKLRAPLLAQELESTENLNKINQQILAK